MKNLHMNIQGTKTGRFSVKHSNLKEVVRKKEKEKGTPNRKLFNNSMHPSINILDLDLEKIERHFLALMENDSNE